MQPTQTGIAVALALAVVVFFLLFDGSTLLGASPATVIESNQTITTTETSSPNMPTNPSSNVTELQGADEVVGTGATATTGDTVTVNYVGALTNGTVFDASAKHQNPDGSYGFTFQLGAGQVIKGWDMGVVGMKEGGRRKLVIPATLAYGSQDYGPIPANSTLIFEIELVKVQKGQ